MTTLTHLDWQPVILLKVVRLPFSDLGGLSLKCAYLAHDSGRILYADWILDTTERAEPLVFATGWAFISMPVLPFLLQGDGAKRVPAGTWVLPYKDSLYTLTAPQVQFSLDSSTRSTSAEPIRIPSPPSFV